jgi:glucosylceramidase
MNARQNLLNSYFGNEGIGYTMGRVPMAGCDFSTRSYSYDDVVNDFELKYFNLTQEDYDLKVLLILILRYFFRNFRDF